MEAVNDDWAARIKDLGYDEDIAWDDFAEHEKTEPTDVQPLVEMVLSEHRPE